MRTVILALLLLAAGAAVNVAVAWGCSIWSNVRYEESETRRGTHEELASYLSAVGMKTQLEPGTWVWGDARVVGAHWIQFGRRSPEGRLALHQHFAGFPMRSLACYGPLQPEWWLFGNSLVSDVDWRGGFDAPSFLKPKETWFFLLPSVWRPLPYRILPIGFIINTLLYALLFWPLLTAPFAARRMIRRKRGQCEHCAYPIGVSDVCTECGAAVRHNEPRA
jgi:hypothetical protein